MCKHGSMGGGALGAGRPCLIFFDFTFFNGVHLVQ